MSITVITGTHDTIAQLRSAGQGEFVMVDVDVADLPDPSDVMGALPGDDPRVFPAMVQVGGERVLESATQACSVARHVATGGDEPVTVLVHDAHGRVQAPAVGGVVAGFLRSVGFEVEITHTALTEILV
jgi:hypothetical protein